LAKAQEIAEEEDEEECKTSENFLLKFAQNFSMGLKSAE
jgi:hypothetical protein